MPSRGEVDSYQRFKRHVEESVGRINGACGTLSSSPVHYVHQSVSQTELVALYRSADAMLVTPLRDGMNLVAKEFVASRDDEDGVLVLSALAGAAEELREALIINPYHIDGFASSIEQAIEMRDEERHTRMRALRRIVAGHDVFLWASDILEGLEQTERREAMLEPPLAVTGTRGRRRSDIGH